MTKFSKIVIRKLPIDLKEEEFLDQIQPYSNFTYFRFCEKDNNEYGSCRAYLNFASKDEMYAFKNDNEFRMFYDSSGNIGCGLFEFAVCQIVPSQNKADSRMNTLEGDPEYKKFLEELETKESSVTKETMESNLEEIKSKETDKNNNPITTPLIEFLKGDKIHKKDTNLTSTLSSSKRTNKKRTTSSIASKDKECKKEAACAGKKKEESVSKSKSGDNKKSSTSARSDIRSYANAYETSRKDGGTIKTKSRYHDSGWYDYDKSEYNSYYSNYDYYGSTVGGKGRYAEYYGRGRGGYGAGYASDGKKRSSGGSNNSHKLSGHRKYPPAPYKKD